MALVEFANRGGCTPQSVTGEFRNRAFTQQAQRYAVAWTSAYGPDDPVLIVATE
ncbi:MAG: hypothetical protein ABWY01_00360 [Pseudoxanthomonas sp.]